MKKNKSIIKNTISLILFLIFGAACFVLSQGGLKNPFEEVVLEDVADIAGDRNGNSYILNGSGYELLRLNAEGEIDLYIAGQSESDKSFMRGLHVAVDDEGKIYVHNRLASDQALSWIGRENIQVFDSKGKFLYTAKDIVYDVPVLNANILKLLVYDGNVYTIEAKEDYVLIQNLSTGEEIRPAFDSADKYVADVCFDAENDTVYLSTRDGRIIKIADKTQETLYDASKEESPEAIFCDIELDEEGNLYACEIISGAVLKLEEDGFTPCFDSESITYGVETTGGMLYNDTYSITREEDGNEVMYETLTLDTGNRVRLILVYLFMILAGLSLMYPLYSVLKVFLFSVSRSVKTLAGFGVVIFILTGCFCAMFAKEFTNILREDFVERASLNAQTVNNLIDAEWFQSLDSVSDFYSDDYLKIKKVVDSVILENGTTPGDMYLIMYTLEGEEDVVVRYSLEEVQGCNYPYIWSDGVDEQRVYKTGETFLLTDATDAEGDFLCVYSPVTTPEGKVIGVIEVGTDSTIFTERVKERVLMIALSIIAFAVVALLIILEIVEFSDSRKQIKPGSLRNGEQKIPLKLYRIAVFIVFFATNITTPFLSIYALSLSNKYSALSGIPAEILAAVPISAEVLFGAVFSMLGGSLIEKLGNRKSGLLGGIMFTVGLVIRFLWPDLAALTVGNAIQGAGWGVVLLIINARIAAEKDEKLQEQGFSNYNIALQNGINSGIVLGGFLLSFLRYKGILILASVISVTIPVFVWFFIYDAMKSEKKEENETHQTGLMAYIRFIFSPGVLIYFLCIVVPVIAASYYLNFLYPILADRMGMNESMIGYSYLLNGLVIIGFGNLIVSFMSKFFNKKILLLLASLIYLVTFALVGLMNSIPALLVSLVLIALSDSFGYVAQSTYYTELKETEHFGYERAMGVYSMFENLSQSAGSFIFGYILTVGVKVGMTAYGIVIGICGVIFVLSAALTNRKDKKKTSEEKSEGAIGS